MRRPLVWLWLVAAALACKPERTESPRTAVRDVVLVTIDTCRADAVGFGGNTRGTTPHLDAVAAEGLVFTSAHAHNVLTLPSHVNVLTGLYPFQHGVRDNTGFRLSDSFPTAATILKEKGYATGAFIAAFPLDSRYGLARGFDTYDMLYRQSEENTELRIQQSPAPTVVQAALQWYRDNSSRPRFLWIHLYDPHAPYDPPPEYRKQFPTDPYLGEVAFTDAALGPLIDAVRGADAPPTLLVVTGDHGEALGDHRELTHGLFAYEATLHVPLLLWSRSLSGRGRDAALARHIDILPTILDAVGDRSTPRLPGASLLSDRKEASARSSYFESLSAAFNRGWAPLRGMLERDQKYIDLPIPELYDLAADAGESHNLAAEKGDALRSLKADLERLPRGPAQPGPVDSEQAARLRSLGYLSGSAPAKTSYGPADDPKTLIAVDRQIHEAVDLFERGDRKAALAVVRQIVAANPRMPLGYQHLAYLLEESGNVRGAIRVLEEAGSRGVSSESLDRRRALLLAEDGRPAEAVAVMRQYEKSADSETLNALGIALADSGKSDEALALFARVLAGDPSNVLALQNTGITWLKTDRPEAAEKARESLGKSIAASPRNPRAWNALGVASMRLGSPEKALEAWSRCVEMAPDQYDTFYNIGIVASRLGDHARARRAFERFLQTAPAGRYGPERAKVRALLAESK